MKKLGLYNSSFEHDACGIGAVVNIKGKKSHDVIDNCLEILENLKFLCLHWNFRSSLPHS